jgi:hypothetical protein
MGVYGVLRFLGIATALAPRAHRAHSVQAGSFGFRSPFLAVSAVQHSHLAAQSRKEVTGAVLQDLVRVGVGTRCRNDRRVASRTYLSSQHPRFILNNE